MGLDVEFWFPEIEPVLSDQVARELVQVWKFQRALVWENRDANRALNSILKKEMSFF